MLSATPGRAGGLAEVERRKAVALEDWIKAVGNLRIPAEADHLPQELMDRDNEGLLTAADREELEALVEFSEQLPLVREEAFQILGKQR